MRKFIFALMCVFAFCSCSLFDAISYADEINDGTDPSFDQYPGMNANTDPLTGIEFTMPDGIVLTDVVVGQQNQRDEENQDSELEVKDDMYGSGLCVIVTLKLENTQNKKDTLYLPAGLMLQAASSSYQNGILAKRVRIAFKAYEKRTVSVRFYCLNTAAHASDADATYTLGPVTNNKAFDPLFNVCVGKKINISQYKSINILSYYGAATTVQQIVWAITQGKTFTEKDIKKYLKHVKND